MNQKRNIFLLILGRTVSKFGSAFYLIALPLYILKRTDNLAWTGLFFTLSSIPALCITPFLGVFVEKVNRKRLIILCDAGTALIYFILCLVSERSRGYIVILFAGTSMVNILANAFEIGSKLIFSELLDNDMIEKYNGIKSIFDNIAAIAAPALGTIVFNLWGFQSILASAAAAYALSAIQECFILYQQTCLKAEKHERGWVRQFAEGLKYVKENDMLFAMFLLTMALNFFAANADEIINPGIIMQKYQIPDSLYGITSSAAVIGTLLAGLFIYKNKRIKLQKYMNCFFLLNSAIAIILGLLSMVMTFVPMLYFGIFVVFQLLLGGITTCVNIPLISYFQTQVPLQVQGRFFALLSVMSGLLVPLGIAYTGFLASLAGADTAYIINNLCIMILVYCAVIRPFRKENR